MNVTNPAPGRSLMCGILCGLLLLAMTAPSYAYLDPGSGSMLIQGLTAIFFGGAATLGSLFRRFRRTPRESEKIAEDGDD